MSTLRISDAPLLPDVDGTEKIPTGGRGDYAISVDQIKDHIFQDVGKELVGLGNVDNTSDLDKPVSTAQQAALNLKADKTYVDENLELKADKTNVYTRSETTLALSKKADLVNGIIPENQIPSSFNDVLEFTTSTLPIVGESGKIYVTTDNNRTWRWGGNQYVEISNGGISDSTIKLQTARKIANVDFDGTQSIDIPHNNLVNRNDENAHTAASIGTASGENQQDINDYNGSKWRNKAGGYDLNARITLDNGDIVRSTVVGNTVNPNVDMTGWELADAALNTRKLKRELVSVWDFFTASEYATYKASPAGFDATQNVQAFFNYICANDVGKAFIDGTFYVTDGLIFGGQNGSLTKLVVGFARIIYNGISNLDTLFKIQCGPAVRWLGGVQVDGAPSIALEYSLRKVNHGVVIGGQYNCSHFSIDYIYAWNGFKQWGVHLANNTTGANIRKIRGERCGSGLEVQGYTASAMSSFTFVSNTSGTTTQRSIISANTIPNLEEIVGPVQAIINNEIYWVERGAEAGTLSLFPQLPSSVAAGMLVYYWGGTFYTSGGDASLSWVGSISSQVSSNAACLNALYAPYIGTLTTQFNASALVVGGTLTAGIVGGAIGNAYFEDNRFDIVQNTRFGASVEILNNTALAGAKIVHTGNYRSLDNIVIAYLCGVNVNSIYGKYQNDRVLLDSGTLNLDLGIVDDRKIIKVNNTALTINLSLSSTNLFKSYFKGSRNLILTSTTGNYTSTVTINPPAGVLVNNSSNQIVLSGLSGITEIQIEVVSPTNIVIRTLRQQSLSNAVVYDPPSIAANSSITTTVALSGATVGSVVQAAFSQYNADIEISAQVSAANTVTVKFKNTSATPIDLASGTLTVKLI